METHCGVDTLSPAFLEAMACWERPERCKVCERNIDKFPDLTELLSFEHGFAVADMLCDDCEFEDERYAWDGNPAFMRTVSRVGVGLVYRDE